LPKTEREARYSSSQSRFIDSPTAHSSSQRSGRSHIWKSPSAIESGPAVLPYLCCFKGQPLISAHHAWEWGFMFFGTTFKTAKAPLLSAPLFWLAVALILLIVLLSFQLSAPIGPMYWDSYIYFDAAQRIKMGQVPNLDFATPVGPLGYYLFAWGQSLFPKAQPLLLVQWSILIVAAPLMFWLLAELRSQSRTTGFLLLVPFLVFATFPANTQSFYPYPGLDGFGIYNRHTSLLLYVLMCGLMFMRDSPKLALFCA